MKFYCCIFFTLLFTTLFGQSSKPTIAKAPSWITTNALDYTQTLLDKDATDGYVNIGYEVQVCLAEQRLFVRRSKKIISNVGVQNESQISVSFNPAYQQLFFNTIRIIRNTTILNKLQIGAMKIVHQEDDLNNFIYNGTLNALFILDDVRQGDVIEYSYTLKGFNPIFKNKFSTEFGLQYSIPIYDIYYKLIVPPGRKMNIKNQLDNIVPVINNVGGQQVYEWRKKNTLPLTTQDYLPSWYNAFGRILISEFNNWKEVNDWAMDLFPSKIKLSPGLQKKITEISLAYPDAEGRTLAALKFVQDDIRYMGIEIGVESHKPADPSKVFTQRFGDCKEKSYLLYIMLKEMGITSNVVLISADNKKTIKDFPPSPTAFDHVTIRVKLKDVFYWFDPTIPYQRGNIKNLFYPDYQAGLVIGDSTSDLTDIQFRKVSYQHTKEVFKVASMYGSGTLLVTSLFAGSDADIIRSDFSTQSNTELLKSYQKFYAGYYENIKADSLTYLDDDSTGIFSTNEYYTLPAFWKVEKGNVNKFSILSFIIDANFRRPKDKDRKMPFRLPFPINFQEEVIVDLPQDWPVKEDEMHFKNAGFELNSKFYRVYNKVHISTDYQNLKDNVTAEEAPAYFKDLKSYDNQSYVDLTYGLDDFTAEQKRTSLKDLLLAVLLLIVFVGGFIWWSQKNKVR